jgi:hypothetical protein
MRPTSRPTKALLQMLTTTRTASNAWSSALLPLMAAAALLSTPWAHAQPPATAAKASTANTRSIAPTPVKIPRLNGKPDFSGIWQTTSAADYGLEPHSGRKDAPPGLGIVEGGQIPYLPEALAQRQKNFENRAKDDPRLKCYTLGVPRGIYYPEPFQIFQRASDLTVLFQFGHSVRTIYTNGTKHPKDPNDWWLGDSRAHWEGDTLVVDVRHFVEDTWLDRSGNYHSDALHVVERWTYIDANTIAYKATLADDKVYSRPWSINVILHRHREKDFQLIENYCFTHEYDEFYPPKPPASVPSTPSAP